MTDPFETLFGADAPVVPRAAFAEQLRLRMSDQLGDLIETKAEATSVNHGSLFYFTLPGADVERAARFYTGLFGWELHRGQSGYHVGNVYPPMGLASNDSIYPEVWIEVDDIETAVARIRRRGGRAADPVHYDSGWNADCVDPDGVHFHVTVPTSGYRQPAQRSTQPGELFYWTLPAPRAAEAKAFYGEVFGWEFGTPGDQGGMHVENRLPDGGIGGGREGTHPELFFRVSNLEAAVAKVRELGGTAEMVGGGDEGRHAMCADDQGVPFGISEPA